MDFRVCMVHGTQGLDALPVAKVTNYPLEERDYRPFAQNIVCVSDGSLRLRMWAFEVSPASGSELLAVLYLFADETLALSVRLAMGEDGLAVPKVTLMRGGETLAEVEGCDFRNHSGEDLQGVFWGGEIGVALSALEALGGTLLIAPGDCFPGNFYKLRATGERRHFGSFTPVDWDMPYDRAGMGRFLVVDY